MESAGVYALLLWPFLACLVLTGIHCYLGIHVVRRGVIFVDLALAQMAFLGSAVAVTVVPYHDAIEPAVAHAALPAEAPRSDPDGPITEQTVDALIPDEDPSGSAKPAMAAPEPAEGREPAAREAQGWNVPDMRAFLGGLLFTLFGAALFSLGRFRDQRIPQEAIIGIIYAVCSAVSLALLYKAPHDVAERTQTMLVGQLLFVEPAKVIETALLYAFVGLVHFRWRRPFMMISFNSQQAEAEGLAVRWWDFLFYATFGAVVTSSVQMAGVLLVFSYLIVPAVCAMLFFERVLPRLCFGWAVGFVGSVLGIRLSVTFDMPTGASIVVSFGALVVLLVCFRAWFARRPTRP